MISDPPPIPFHDWTKRHTPLLLWALLTGVVTGTIATVFHMGLDWIDHWREHVLPSAKSLPLPGWLILAVCGAAAVTLSLWVVRRFAPEAGGSGIQEIEGALEGVRPLRWWRILPVKFFGGLLSLGSGMVLGREGPTIQMGGSVGRMLSDWRGRTGDDSHWMIAAGSAAGLAAAFNAPVAGVLFVLEEMRSQFRYSFTSVLVLAIATVSAVIMVRIYLGQAPDMKMERFAPPDLASLWFFLVLGALFGFIGMAFNRLLLWFLDAFGKIPGNGYLASGALVGATIGLLGWFMPDLTGSGYDAIYEALGGALTLSSLLVLFVARMLVTLISYGCGAPGGIFAPMLALGTLFGLWFGSGMQLLFPDIVPHPAIFAVGGMGALFAATVQAPLTGILLVVEMTGNYELILPLFVTCLSSTLVSRVLGGRPVYTLLLHRTLVRARPVADGAAG
jgi:CIC family chloride channel protein